MTLFFLAALATADEPAIESVTAVASIEWAQPFTLSEAASYKMRGDHPTFDAGTLVQLTVEPGMARARAVDQPVLYIGAFPARVLNPSERGTCLIAWAPTPLPLDQTPLFYGARTLPERITAEMAAQQVRDAVQAGAKPMKALATHPAIHSAGLDPIWEAAQAAVARCALEPPN